MPMIPNRLALRPAGVLLALMGSLCGSAFAQMVEPEPDPAPAMLTGNSGQPAAQPQEGQDDRAGRPRGGRIRPGGPMGEDARMNQPGLPPAADPNEPTVSFGVFSEPMQLTTLIDFVGSTLGLNIVVKGSPTGEVVFNAPVEVPRSRLLDLLDAMLEQYSFTITNEPTTGFYIVQPISDVKPSVSGERASVRIIPTPNIRPSQLAATLGSTLSVGSGAAAPGGAAPGGGSIQAVDELGVLIVTAPARDIARVEALVGELMQIDASQQRIRFELEHIAAPAALERAIGLVGGSSQSTTNAFQPQINRGGGRFQENQPGGVPTTTGGAGTLSNLADRMTVDPQGNALIFRGFPVEVERVREILNVIDVPNKLKPKEYFAGSAAAQVADIASRRGLGEVVQVSSDQTANLDQFNPFRQQQFGQPNQSTSTSSIGGPVMVVDVERGRIVYYGTTEQQQQLAELMDELKTDDERVVIREYVLNHSDAETVADLLTGIITGQRQTGDSPLLPTQGNFGTRQLNTPQGNFFAQFAGGDDVSAAFDPDVVVVIPDIENNQVVVKAPIKQQEELAKLIERLDRRRAQVYIQAQIVAVTDNEDFTLAFESQYLRGEFGIGTNFGLSNIGNTTNFTDPKDIAAGLGGLTTAIIRSDYIPLIINATQTDTDVRILSSPQVLVNDNEEASIVSIEEQPYSTTNFGQTTDTTSFGGYETAGTQLTVTPSISDGGFLRLEYSIELSNFITASGTADLPPPKNTRTVTGKATIPTDATIVIGGLTVEDVRDTVVKVPFIGDIPLLGELFKRTNKVNNKAKLYVFLTPRIMTDPNFNDLKLLTQGPQAQVGVAADAPELEPATIRSIQLPKSADAPALSPESIN